MSSLDSQSLFSSGPCEIVPGPWDRKTIRRGVAGLDGELVLDLGKEPAKRLKIGAISKAPGLLHIPYWVVRIALLQSLEKTFRRYRRHYHPRFRDALEMRRGIRAMKCWEVFGVGYDIFFYSTDMCSFSANRIMLHPHRITDGVEQFHGNIKAIPGKRI